MNAEELIEEVIDIVDDADYEDSSKVLKYVNQAAVAIADLLYFPDLSDGYDVLTTLTDSNEVPLPDDFQKGLFLATTEDGELNVFLTRKDYVLVNGIVTLDENDVTDIFRQGDNLIYQGVPAVAVDIAISYYRRPTPMLDKPSSYPEGLRDSDDYDWALIHHAAAKIFNKIEDGMAGEKVNHMAHKAAYMENVTLLNDYAETIGVSHANRPSTKISWLGGN